MSSPAFLAAVKESKQLKAKPTDTELLQLYAYFKQASQSPPIEGSEVPGTFDFKGKAKRRAWQKVVDEGVTPKAAEEAYVALMAELKTKYGIDESKEPEAVGGK